MGQNNPLSHTDADDRPAADNHGVSIAQVCLIAIAIAVIGATFRVAAIVILPLVVGIWLALLLWPIHDRLRRFLPVWISAILSVASLLLAMALFGGFAWYAGERAANHIQTNQPAYASKYQTLRAHAQDLGIPPPWLPQWTSHPEQPQTNDGWDDDFQNNQTDENTPEQDGRNEDQPDSPRGNTPDTQHTDEQRRNSDNPTEPADPPADRASNNSPNADGPSGADAEFLGRSRQEFLSWITGGLRSGLAIFGTLTLTVLFVVLALVEFPVWQRWSSHAFGPSKAELIGSIARVNAKLVRRYFVAKLITGLVSGVATAAFLWAMGVPMPLVWGLLTLVMNFVPNIGAVISAIPPTALALLELGLVEGVIVACGLLAIEMLVGNLLDPLIQGDALDLSPFVVLASLLFWGWLWGVIGAVLAPTLTAAIVSAFRVAASQQTRNGGDDHQHSNERTHQPVDDND